MVAALAAALQDRLHVPMESRSPRAQSLAIKQKDLIASRILMILFKLLKTAATANAADQKSSARKPKCQYRQPELALPIELIGTF